MDLIYNEKYKKQIIENKINYDIYQKKIINIKKKYIHISNIINNNIRIEINLRNIK